MKNKKEKIKRLILLDAHAIIHRAYHALPDFASSKGEPTGALYGISTMLLKIVADFNPDYIVACYDLPGPTYRHEVYESYKAGRKKTDEPLVKQLERSKDVFTAFNIPIYSLSGFEADDILGTIVEKLKNNPEIEIIIASGDMDTLQLVSGIKVKVFTLKKGINDTIIYDEKAVRERFGFGPEIIPDYKGFCGDPSDNIPGIRGIGEKTATILLTNFGSVEGVYKALKKNIESLEKAGITKRIIELLKQGEEEAIFSKMLATIRRDVPIEFVLPEEIWKENFNPEPVLSLFRELEFRTLGERVKNLNGNSDMSEPVSEEKIDLLELEETKIVLWLVNSNMTMPEEKDVLQFADTKSFEVARKKIFEELQKRNLVKVFEEIEKPLIPIVLSMEKWGIKIDKKYLEDLSTKYHKTLKSLEQKIWKEAEEEFNINSPKQLGEILFEKLGLKVKNQKKTGTGARSTKESELEKIKDSHPIVPAILEYREIAKLLSTYIDSIPKLLDKDNRLHSHFEQTGTTTGRMSSNDPNIQNIPIKTDLGRAIRNAFIASDGYELVAIDYSQIELRVAAILSRDSKLMEIFKSGGDVHSATASFVFGVPKEKIDSEMRRRAKIINFGILYGMGVNALKVNLGTSREEAQQFLASYFNTFEGLAHYLDEVKNNALKNGFTETLFGRRRYFDGLKSSLPFIRASAERMAINAPIQGTAADIIKIAMNNVFRSIEKEKLLNEARILLQVHDELVFEVKKERVAQVVPEIKKIMESVLSTELSLGVPIVVNAKVGKNWGEMKEV